MILDTAYAERFMGSYKDNRNAYDVIHLFKCLLFENI